MRYLFGIICVCSLGVLPILGCSETTGDGGAGGDAGAGGSAGSGGAGGDSLTYVIRFTGLEPDGSVVGVEGVELCEADTDNCALSNVLGTATLVLPADQEILLTAEKEGYGKWLTADVSDEDAEASTTRRIYTDAQLEAVASQLNTAYPWTDGIVGLVKNPSETEGLTFAPAGSTAGAVGESFYYDSATEEYRADLVAGTAVETNWYLPLGAGGFTEVTPGEQQFEFGGTAGNCVASWAWPGDTANTIRVPVREGYRTYGSMICTAQ
ncbi:MAG: hypothetical protein OEN21_09870 [Myxococcales bacterium]|nr:hypothetical protein [Myxococcales bacterium]